MKPVLGELRQPPGAVCHRHHLSSHLPQFSEKLVSCQEFKYADPSLMPVMHTLCNGNQPLRRLSHEGARGLVAAKGSSRALCHREQGVYIHRLCSGRGQSPRDGHEQQSVDEGVKNPLIEVAIDPSPYTLTV